MNSNYNIAPQEGKKKTRTLIGNWYEDELWAQTTQKEGGLQAHSGVISTSSEFDPDKPQEDVIRGTKRSSVGKRQLAMQEELRRKAQEEVIMGSQGSAAPPLSPNSTQRLSAATKQGGKKTSELKNK